MGPFRIKSKQPPEGFTLVHGMVDEATGQIRGHLSAWAETKEDLTELMEVCAKMVERDVEQLNSGEERKGNA